MCSSSREVALLLYYRKENQYSFNALLGAAEDEELLDLINVFFVKDPKQVHDKLRDLLHIDTKIMVAFSVVTFQVPEVINIVSSLRKKISSKKILWIAGGPHATGDPIELLSNGFDIVIRGEGEKVFTDLLKSIISKTDFETINGIGFSKQGKYHLNPIGKRPDINAYSPFSIKYEKFGPIEISRGCPWTCSFCQTPFIFGVHVRHRAVPIICRYVKLMKSKGLTDIRFITPNAFMYGSRDGKTINLNAIENLLNSIRSTLGEEGRIYFGTFPSEVRPEHVTPETLELVKRYCNNDNLVMGAQSGSDKMLKYIHRGHSVDELIDAVELTLKSGLKANVDLLFGLPREKEEDTCLTLQLAKKLSVMGARIHAHTFMPLPGTPFWNMPPGKIDPRVKKEIEQLISIGKLYGNWRYQEKIAYETAVFRDRRHLKGKRTF